MAQEKNRANENSNLPFKVNYSDVLKELASLRVQLEEEKNKVKQFDSLQDHAKTLSSKLFEMHAALKEKEAQIDQYKKMAQKPIELASPEVTGETLPEPDCTLKTSKEFKVKINFR